MSAGQIIGAIAGAVVTYYSGNAAAGFAVYSAIAGISSYLDQPDRQGPRLEDLRQQLSVYGAPIPFEYGTNRHAGTVIWPEILEADEHSHSESAKGGPESTTYTYSMSFAVLVCEGPIAGIRRIWANKKLIYDASLGNEGATRDPMISGLRIYLGTEDQEVDPLIEGRDGPSPAYLGYAYVVFEDYDVTEMNGRLPQFEFEVVTASNPGNLDAVALGPCGNKMAIDTNTGYVWSVKGVPNTRVEVYITDPISGGLITQFDIDAGTSSIGSDIAFNPEAGNPDGGGGYGGQFWIANETVLGLGAILYVNADVIVGGPDSSPSLPRYWPPHVPPGSYEISYGGLIHYSAAYGKMLWGVTNIDDSLFVIDANGVVAEGESSSDPQMRMGLSGDIFGLDQILDLEDGRVAVLGYQKVAIGAPNGVNTGYDNVYTNTSLSGTNAFMASDKDRNRILVINDAGSSIFELNVDTGAWTEHEIIFPEDIPPTASTAFRRILWHSENDKYYVTSHEGGLDWALYTINPVTYEVESCRLYAGPTSTGSLLEYPNHPEFLVYTDSGTNTIYKLPLFNLIDPEAVLLADIVTDICARADLDASQIDVTDLTDEVKGYIVPRQMTARAALEVLQTAFYFDAVESDGKVKFVKRGSSTTTTIPMDDRAAHVDGEEVPAHLEIRRAFDTELPIQCDIEYPDYDADHQIGNQYDRRITKDTRHRINLQLAIVMSAPKAKEIARCVLYQAWQKQTFRWVTTRKFAYLEPTDVVSLPTGDVNYRARITNRRDQPNGLIEWEGSIEDQAVYNQSGDDAVTPPYQIQSVFDPSQTYLGLLDIPLLRDEDDNAGFYVAMGGRR